MSGLNNRLVSNNEVLTANCSLFTVPVAQNAGNAAFADWQDSSATAVDFKDVKGLWIINPIGSDVTVWIRGPGDLSPTGDANEGLKLSPGADTFLPINESALNSWGGNLQTAAEAIPVVFVVFR